jgi:hypothetical protein
VGVQWIQEINDKMENGVWRQKVVRGNNDQGICPLCIKEDRSGILRSERSRDLGGQGFEKED